MHPVDEDESCWNQMQPVHSTARARLPKFNIHMLQNHVRVCVRRGLMPLPMCERLNAPAATHRPAYTRAAYIDIQWKCTVKTDTSCYTFDNSQRFNHSINNKYLCCGSTSNSMWPIWPQRLRKLFTSEDNAILVRYRRFQCIFWLGI